MRKSKYNTLDMGGIIKFIFLQNYQSKLNITFPSPIDILLLYMLMLLVYVFLGVERDAEQLS